MSHHSDGPISRDLAKGLPPATRRPYSGLESGAPGGIRSIAGGVGGPEAPQRRTGRVYPEGAPGKRGRDWGPSAGRAAWKGGSGVASVPRSPGETPRHPLAGSGYLATRRRLSQQALLLTQRSETTRSSMPRGPGARTTSPTRHRPPFPNRPQPLLPRDPAGGRRDPFPALPAPRAARSR